jgi:hypothetical protein
MKLGAAALLAGLVAWFPTDSSAEPSIGLYFDAAGTSQTVEVTDAFDGAYIWLLVKGLSDPVSYVEFGITIDSRLDLAYVETPGPPAVCPLPGFPPWPENYFCENVGCAGGETVVLIFLQVLIFNAPQDASICVTAASPSLLNPARACLRGCPTSDPVEVSLASSPYGDGCVVVNPVSVAVRATSWGSIKALYQ